MRRRYEKRLTLQRLDSYRTETVHQEEAFTHIRFMVHDTTVDVINDGRFYYYWKANKGGSWHAEVIDQIIGRAALKGGAVDLVGCNSPKRGLFKRQFGGTLVPYYMVITADPKSIAEFWPPQEAAVA